MHLRVVLGDRLDIVVPALFLAVKATLLKLVEPMLLSVETNGSISSSRRRVEASSCTEASTVCLRKSHGVDLSAKEGNGLLLTLSTWDVINHTVTVRLVLL